MNKRSKDIRAATLKKLNEEYAQAKTIQAFVMAEIKRQLLDLKDYNELKKVVRIIKDDIINKD